MKRILASVLLCSLFLASCSPGGNTGKPTASGGTAVRLPPVPSVPVTQAAGFGENVAYAEPITLISPDLAKDFSVDEIQNLKAIEQAYGFTLTAAERQFLSENKFVVKNLLDTSLRPTFPRGVYDRGREFVGLYHVVSGSPDPRDRKPENSVFYTSDVFANLYTILFTELLKEMENARFFPMLQTLTKTFYASADKKIAEASSAEGKAEWTKVRNYFAVPYAIFATVGKGPEPVPPQELTGDEQKPDPDATIDTPENVTAFVKTLKMDVPSETAVLADLKQVYDASGKAVPEVFKQEYADYATRAGMEFFVDFSQFTPRSHYTGSSIRRQYFRGVMWLNQVPFFLKSPALTQYAYDATQLLAENPEQLKGYGDLESMITFLVGESDDLMPADYLSALAESKGKPDQEAAVMEYLRKARDPKIKSLAAAYPSVGLVQSQDVLDNTKGMRFFSGKFLLDSYWTGFLTQGDEAPRPGYPGKLPPMASSLEVMALLGSDYAKSKIPTLVFYKDHGPAIDKAMTELGAEAEKFNEDYWKRNVYSVALWAIRGLFGWQKANLSSLPRFMQSPLWDVKTLQTAAGLWTEMRHATLLYAKQSFAEMGGGPPACDSRKIPEAPKGYIEPQPVMYARLLYLAERTEAGLKDRGYSDLSNMYALEAYTELLRAVSGYVADELKSAEVSEKIVEHNDPDMIDEGKTCTWYSVEEGGRWEQIRMLVEKLDDALPQPVEGPILPVKDKRAALLADVHTGGDSQNPPRILYEGIGVPRVILVAVKDGNGPRLTVGFTYSQYEFTEPYGGKRMTDEQWQEKFYTGEDPYESYNYTEKSSWPATNSWYVPLVGDK